MGHQYLTEHYGGKVVIGPEIMHGKVSRIEIAGGDPLFSDVGLLDESGC